MLWLVAIIPASHRRKNHVGIEEVNEFHQINIAEMRVGRSVLVVLDRPFCYSKFARYH